MAADSGVTQAGSGAAAMIAWREASKVYARKYRAVRRVTLEVMRGEILGVAGASGSGKSTLLKLVNRLAELSSGDVIVDGISAKRWEPIALRRTVGYVVAGGGLLPHLSATDNAGIVARMQGHPRDECRQLARQHLEMVGVDPKRFGARRPAELEPAQRVRVGLARALVGGGEIMLLDDPLAGLDAASRRPLEDELRAFLKQLGKTVVFATADITEACHVADRVAQLEEGQLLRLGLPSDFGAHSPAPLVAALATRADDPEPSPSVETRA